MIVIIDDFDAVWTHVKNEHLVQVDEYQFFYNRYYAFDEETTVTLLEQERQTGQQATVSGSDTDNNHLMLNILKRLQGLHGMCFAGGACRPERVKRQIRIWNDEKSPGAGAGAGAGAGDESDSDDDAWLEALDAKNTRFRVHSP